MTRLARTQLQTLGTFINVDLPSNPSCPEQPLGRIRRFGQARRTVDMLNLVYSDTQDEYVYRAFPVGSTTSSTSSGACQTPLKTTGSRAKKGWKR